MPAACVDCKHCADSGHKMVRAYNREGAEVKKQAPRETLRRTKRTSNTHWYCSTYVLIMLCHNFLIGKGHACALRTTCVLGVRVRYVHVYARLVLLSTNFPQAKLLIITFRAASQTCERLFIKRVRSILRFAFWPASH